MSQKSSFNPERKCRNRQNKTMIEADVSALAVPTIAATMFLR